MSEFALAPQPAMLDIEFFDSEDFNLLGKFRCVEYFTSTSPTSYFKIVP
jgi:hypothetical protein